MSEGPIGVVMGAMRYWERRQQSMAHNLANVSTCGFKAERVFARLGDAGAPAPVAEARTDFSGGTVSVTNRPLDVALDGEGFLVVSTPRGERWSRGGALSLDDAGALVDGSGNPVMGANGPLVLPPGEVRIAPSGSIEVEGVEVGRLRIERGAEGDAPPEREGGVYFRPAERRRGTSEDAVTIRQGHLEEANLEPVGSLVEMMEIQRAYAALQRSAAVVDGVMETAANELGRVK